MIKERVIKERERERSEREVRVREIERERERERAERGARFTLYAAKSTL